MPPTSWRSVPFVQLQPLFWPHELHRLASVSRALFQCTTQALAQEQERQHRHWTAHRLALVYMLQQTGALRAAHGRAQAFRLQGALWSCCEPLMTLRLDGVTLEAAASLLSRCRTLVLEEGARLQPDGYGEPNICDWFRDSWLPVLLAETETVDRALLNLSVQCFELLLIAEPALLCDGTYSGAGSSTALVDLLFEPLLTRRSLFMFGDEGEVLVAPLRCSAHATALYHLNTTAALLCHVRAGQRVDSEAASHQVFGDSYDSLLFDVALPSLLGFNINDGEDEFDMTPIDDQHRHEQRTLLTLLLNEYGTRHEEPEGRPLDISAWVSAAITRPARRSLEQQPLSRRPDLVVVLQRLTASHQQAANTAALGLSLPAASLSDGLS